MKKYQLIILAIALGLFFSCATDEAVNPELPGTEKEPEVPIDEVIESGFCDTITYSKHIEPIFSTNCTFDGCHNGSDPNRLDYRKHSVIASDMELILTALEQKGTFKMPYDPDTWETFKLPDSTINLIKCWDENGAKND